MKPRGWTGHPREHALAARGIPCRASAVFRPYRSTGPIDYREPEEVFKAFWKASVEDDFTDFDWDRAFANLGWQIDWRLSEIGLGSREEFEEWIAITWGDYPAWFEHHWPEKYEELRNKGISDSQIYDRYFDWAVVEARKEVKWSPWKSLNDISVEMKRPGKTLVEKIILMDKIIHAVHENDTIWLDDIPQGLDVLREEFDREYGRSMG